MSRLVCALALLLLAAPPVAAQQQHMNMPGMGPMKGMPGMDMDEVRSNAPFRPGLGDLMTALVQPRHIKLGLAGAAQNWPYAAYALDELREAFDVVGKLIVRHGKLDIAPAIAATVTPPMKALDGAIKAKDQTGFTKAYADLTAGCNACHQSADHAMIVIQAPTGNGTAFADQDFTPPK